MLQEILSSALCLIKESYDPKTTWLVNKEQVHAIKRPLRSLPIENPPLPASLPPSVEPVLQPAIEPVVDQEEKKESKPTEAPPLSFDHFSQTLLRIFPRFPLRKEPLSDRSAHLQFLQKNILLFSFREGKESDLLLQNLQKALEVYHGSCAVVDMSRCSEGEDLLISLQETEAQVILSSHAIFQNKTMRPFLKQLPISNEHFLGKCPLILLDSSETYFASAEKKKTLWNTLCTLLKNQNTPESSSITP